MSNKSLHSFHIPVMGIAFTIDTPIRVAQFGISSAISIIDDDIIEKMRYFYSKKYKLNFSAISIKADDHRAKRITAYLNLVDDLVNQKFTAFKEELIIKKQSLINFIEILPNTSKIKSDLQNFLSYRESTDPTLKNYLDSHLSPGGIDVNIMTKVDKENYKNNEQLPIEYNDAHASLRGFAQSKLSSSLVLSAGMNPRLYSYIEQFDDFYPDTNNHLMKKIILKVSDFRSAMIQGQFLAKKGLWVSEYRIESGLNCGGHAFATEGVLLGPILEEFKKRKNELIESNHHLLVSALKAKSKYTPAEPYELKITVQGGVGTNAEHHFLMSHYNLDSIGWGSPFLLVPEATSVDSETRTLLKNAKREDFYLSNISPLGILFNTVKGTSNEMIRKSKHNKTRFGSSCPKKFLALSKEFSSQGLCMASTKYLALKFEHLEKEKEVLEPEQFQKREQEITAKVCLCVGLANSAYIENKMEVKGEKQGVVICPGPNLAYFDKEVSLSQMIKHIYGNANILADTYRPNIFINELKMYVEYMKKGVSDSLKNKVVSNQKKWEAFSQNLLKGIAYYESLFADPEFQQLDVREIFIDLQKCKLEAIVQC